MGSRCPGPPGSPPLPSRGTWWCCRGHPASALVIFGATSASKRGGKSKPQGWLLALRHASVLLCTPRSSWGRGWLPASSGPPAHAAGGGGDAQLPSPDPLPGPGAVPREPARPSVCPCSSPSVLPGWVPTLRLPWRLPPGSSPPPQPWRGPAPVAARGGCAGRPRRRPPSGRLLPAA